MQRLLALVLLVGWCSLAEAARTVTAEGTITVKLDLGEPTALVFPEEISTVTTGMPEERLMINKDQAYVGFIARDPSLPRNRNIVVGLSGKVYMVYVEMVAAGQRSDDMVYVTHKPPVQAEQLTPVGVLRTLRSPKGPGPAQPLTLALPSPPDARVTLSHPKQYTLGQYQALVLTLTNTQDTPVSLDDRVGAPAPDLPGTVRLHDWVWPPKRRLVAIAAEQDVLPAGGTTLLYAVFEERY